MAWYEPWTWFDGGGAGQEFKRADPSAQATNPSDEAYAQQNPKVGANIYQGTTHQAPLLDYEDVQANGHYGIDQRNFMYGRDPAAADAAVNRAFNTGQGAQTTGENLLGLGLNNSQAAGQRQAMLGDWGQQNNSLGIAGGYGQSLASLENQQGPSAAQAQLQQGTNQGMQSQIAMARSGRGFGGGAGAAGLAQSNMAGISANQANQSAMLRAQEDAAWRGRQANNLNAAAGIQQGIAGQFGQQQGTDLNAYYQGQGQNDAAALGWAGYGADAYGKGVSANLMGQGLANDIRGTELGAGMGHEDAWLRAWAAQNGYNLAEGQRQDQKDAANMQMGMTALAGAAALASDVRSKKDIVKTDVPALDFARAGSMVSPKAPDFEALDAVAASPGYGYMYQDPSAPGAAEGQQYGPMAQDLAATPAGRTAVVEMDDGKLGIDPARLTTLNTSALSAQQRELDLLKQQIAAFSEQPGAVYPRPSQGSF